MFGNLFGNKDKLDVTPKAPEILGLFLGGSFTIDALYLRLVEPDLIIEGAAATQIIQAVGVIKLDDTSTLLRYYTDDDGFLQALVKGAFTDANVSDLKLWYFYETQQVGNDWEQILDNKISMPTTELEGFAFTRVWCGAGDSSPPLAFTEKTYHLDGRISETDQFVMLYERAATANLAEYLTLAGEERVVDNQAERCFVICSGFDVQQANLRVA